MSQSEIAPHWYDRHISTGSEEDQTSNKQEQRIRRGRTQPQVTVEEKEEEEEEEIEAVSDQGKPLVSSSEEEEEVPRFRAGGSRDSDLYQDSFSHTDRRAERIEESEEEPTDNLPSTRTRKSSKSASSVRTKSTKSDFVSRTREMLKKVFQFYASFGSRCNTKFLKPSQFIKMMVDAEISDGSLSHTKLDILFLQACKRSKSLEFEDFLELLFLVAAKKCRREQNPDKAFKELLARHLQPLFDRILLETEMGVEDKILHAPLTVSTLLVLRMVSKPLQAVYVHYFEWETNRPLQEKPSATKVESELFTFLRDFEICPQLVPKSSAYSLFGQVLGTNSEDLCRNEQYRDLAKILGRDLGESFTFFKFVVYLSRLGIYIFSDATNVPQAHKSTGFTVDEKVYLLLERLDISGGVSHLPHIAKSSAPGQHRLSLSRDSLLHIHKETGAYPNFFFDGEEEGLGFGLGKVAKKMLKGKRSVNGTKEDAGKEEEEFMYIKMAKRGTKAKKAEKEARESASSLKRRSGRKEYFPRVRGGENKENENRENRVGEIEGGPTLVVGESYDACERYLKEMHGVFESYCSFGEAGNFSTMRSAKFTRLMRDTGVFESRAGTVALETQDVDLIFCSVLHGIDPFGSQSRKKAKATLLKFKNEEEGGRSTSPMRQRGAKGMSFALFLQCVEAVAMCTEKEVEREHRMERFVERRVLPLFNKKDRKPSAGETRGVSVGKMIENKEDFSAKLMSVLRDKTMVEILSSVHKAILPLYLIYCDETKMMNVKKFLQFMKDFGVFPQVVSQVKLHQLFHELSSLFKNKAGSVETKEDVVDQHLFVEGLTLIALEVEYEKFKLTNAQKLILLLERMNDSDASQKLSRCLGRTISKRFDIVSQVRQKFSEHFKF